MLQVYLPVAEISVNLLVMLGLGAAIGFLSGMFGVGGGFLLTPLLMFSGIPPAIAVATGANQIVASSVSGALVQWRRGNIDFRMGWVLIIGGVFGAVAGVLLVGLLSRLGHADVFISLVYVTFLGVIGSLMTRYGWVRAGHASSQNWRIPLDIPEDSRVDDRMQSKPTLPQARSVERA